MKSNQKYFRSDSQLQINPSFTSSLSKLDRKRLVFEQLSNNHDKIIGSHKKFPSLSLNFLTEIDLKNQKFKRTPSPDKKSFRAEGNSPFKPPTLNSGRFIDSPFKPPNLNSGRFMDSPFKHPTLNSGRYIDLIRENFGVDDKDTLSLVKIDSCGIKRLKEKGFVGKNGVVNHKFVTRYAEVIGARHPLKKAKSAAFLKKLKRIN